MARKPNLNKKAGKPLELYAAVTHPAFKKLKAFASPWAWHKQGSEVKGGWFLFRFPLPSLLKKRLEAVFRD